MLELIRYTKEARLWKIYKISIIDNSTILQQIRILKILIC